jgi:hypothetical protein
VEDESHGDDLGAHLHREDAHEDRLQLLQLTEIYSRGLVWLAVQGVKRVRILGRT